MTGKERKNTEHIDGEKNSSDGTENECTNCTVGTVQIVPNW